MSSATERQASAAGPPDPAWLVDPPAADSATWLRSYSRGLIAIDAAMVTVSAFVAVRLRFGEAPAALHGLPYLGVGLLLVVVWLAVLGVSRCYETRFLGSGAEEFKRVGDASIRLLAVVAVIGFGLRIDVARGYVAIALPLGTVLLVLGRLLARRELHRRRRQGRCSHRVLVVGSPAHVRELVIQLRREPLAGLRVVGACISGPSTELEVAGGPPVPVVGSLMTVKTAMVRVQADTVAVTASPGLTGGALRALSYELEGTGVGLLVAPALTNVVGTRISIRPVAGLPLLHVDEPELTGGRKLFKAFFDLSLSVLLLVLLLPFLVLIALAIRLTSRGPALFRQTRVGRDGRLFTVWKFRSMYAGAEQRQAELDHLNEHDGVLFKIREDPRVTPVGRLLRAYSLDELPQLVNVLRGQMSLVGPRPPLPSEVERYEGHTRRRLLVKPGITGLWQVSGRADLSWDETVRLDLQYVENWSLGLDLSLVAKTVASVLRRRGAY